MNSRLRFWLITAGFLIFGASSTRYTYAAPQGPGCSLLTPAQIQKVLGQAFGAPSETNAPPAYGNNPWGSNCRYSSQSGAHREVTFIIYVDASPAEAKQTFEKLRVWYMPKSKPAIGGSAYVDAKGAIHVLKGKVRYYISLDPANEKQIEDLALAIAART